MSLLKHKNVVPWLMCSQTTSNDHDISPHRQIQVPLCPLTQSDWILSNIHRTWIYLSDVSINTMHLHLNCVWSWHNHYVVALLWGPGCPILVVWHLKSTICHSTIGVCQLICVCRFNTDNYNVVRQCCNQTDHTFTIEQLILHGVNDINHIQQWQVCAFNHMHHMHQSAQHICMFNVDVSRTTVFQHIHIQIVVWRTLMCCAQSNLLYCGHCCDTHTCMFNTYVPDMGTQNVELHT